MSNKIFLSNLLIGIITGILIAGFFFGPANAEKYTNATGEVVEMPKGMKAPPKQAWDTQSYQLSPGGKATPITTSTTSTKTQSQPLQQQTTTPTVQQQPKTTQSQQTTSTVRSSTVQRKPVYTQTSPRPSPRIEPKYSPPKTVYKKPRPVVIPPPVNEPKTTEPEPVSQEDTASVSSEDMTSSEKPLPAEGEIPDATLPLAAGAAAGVAALGALSVAFAQGIRPVEAVGELIGLFRGELSPVGDSLVSSPSALDEDTLEAQRYKKAYDDLIKERRQSDYTGTDKSRSLMDQARDEVQKQYELEKNSTWGALDQIAIEDLINNKAPSKEARDAMLNIVQSYTADKLSDGTSVINRKAMLNDVSNYLADANRLDKSKFTADEIDSAFYEQLEQVKKEHEALDNAAVTSTAYGSVKDNIDLLKDLQKTGAYTNNPQAKKALDFLLSKTDSFQKLDEQGMSIVGDAGKWSNHVVEFGEYYKTYQRMGMNHDEALKRAITRKIVDITVEQGVDALQNKCPVVKAANYFYDYGVKAITGKDYGLKTSLNCLGQRTANWAYSDYQTHLPDFKLDSNAVRESNVAQIEKLIKVSSGSEKQQLQEMLTKIKKKGA